MCVCVCGKAFVHMARLERERAEVQQKREEEARRRHREHITRVKKMLEAAFDGDTAEINTLLKEVSQPLQCKLAALYHRRSSTWN